MALILCLETATKVCSVCLSKDGLSIISKSLSSEKYSHAEKLNGLIMELFEDGPYSLKNIDAIAVSEGPGSYTGLRIGTSTAKGLCYALDKPLIAINSLKSLAALVQTDGQLICPMFDARRLEVYSAIFDSDLNTIEPTQAVVIDEGSYKQHLRNSKVLFIGPGANKCVDLITDNNATFNLEIIVNSEGMTQLAEDAFQAGNFADLAYFEPFYLKDFIAGSPKKMF